MSVVVGDGECLAVTGERPSRRALSTRIGQGPGDLSRGHGPQVDMAVVPRLDQHLAVRAEDQAGTAAAGPGVEDRRQLPSSRCPQVDVVVLAGAGQGLAVWAEGESWVTAADARGKSLRDLTVARPPQMKLPAASPAARMLLSWLNVVSATGGKKPGPDGRGSFW